MTGVASWDCSQPTGGEAGGEIRNCFSGFGGSKRGLPMCTDCTEEEERRCGRKVRRKIRMRRKRGELFVNNCLLRSMAQNDRCHKMPSAANDLTCAKYSRISLPLKSVLCSRSRASAAARASLKLIRTRRKDLKYWNVTSGSKERNRASKLACMETERVEIGIRRRNRQVGENTASAFLPPSNL